MAGCIKEYRPIVVCNALYLVITKVLALRLSSILLDLIYEYQMPFIRGRLMLNNYVIVGEIISWWQRFEQKELYFSKAYDCLD